MTRQHEQLDDFIRDEVSPNPLSLFDRSLFLGTLRKLAAAGPPPPAPDQDLAEHEAEVATGQEASPEEAGAHTVAGEPDTSGHLEGEFAVPVDQVVMTLANIVSNSMRQHTAYAYYGEMMRGLGRGELAELFDEQGDQEVEEMKYFLRRMGVLMPGGVTIPPAPTPEPSDDPQVALNFLIAGEQQAIVLFKTLHAQLGENPMKYTLEQMQTDAQGHMDKLWQYMPSGASEKQAAEVKAKIASALAKINTAADKKKPTPAQGPVVVPPLGTESTENVIAREATLALQQSEAEKADLVSRLQQTEQMAVSNQAAAEQANATAQQASQMAESSNQEAALATQDASMARDEATASMTQAASEAEAKMRLAMRIQQIRQDLANMASADPVGEEGLSHGGGAGPGAPMTPGQQGQAAAEQAANDQLAQEQLAAQSTGGGKAKKETAQAQRAQQDAEVQTQQAQSATQGA